MTDTVSGDGREQAAAEALQSCWRTSPQTVAEGIEGLQCPFETDLSWLQPMFLSRLRHHLANQIVGQHMDPDFFADHLRTLATQDVHLQKGFERTQIEFGVPALAVEYV